MLKLQVSPSLFSSLRDRLSSREVDYINFYSDHLPLQLLTLVSFEIDDLLNLTKIICLRFSKTLDSRYLKLF